MNKDEHLKMAKNVQGWMCDDFLSTIYDNAVNKGLVLEIGCWRGKTTSVLACAKKVIVIDSWDFNTAVGGHEKVYKEMSEDINIFEDFKSNTSAFNNIEIIKGKSKEVYNQVVDNSIDFIVLDGSHFYIDVKNDLNAYFSKLKNDGIIFCHDYEDGEVKKAIDEFVMERNLKIQAITVDGTAAILSK